ncbi:MAG: hypothetical protein KAG66_13850, partial [Methylococcales bacterium]|nr:hypothetical protein [Methylococcales bacterium]
GWGSIVLFSESELNRFGRSGKTLHCEQESLACDHETLPDEDDLHYFRVYFAAVKTFSILYRHLVATGRSLSIEYGCTHLYINDQVDEKWSGRIVYDLRNQRLDEREKSEMQLLVHYQMDTLQRWHKAGFDREVDIRIEILW